MPGPQEYTHLGSGRSGKTVDEENVGGYRLPKRQGGEEGGYSVEPESDYDIPPGLGEREGRDAA